MHTVKYDFFQNPNSVAREKLQITANNKHNLYNLYKITVI